MSSLESLLNNLTLNENNDISYKSTLNACVDLYTSCSNNRNTEYLETLLNKAYEEDKQLTLCIILNLYSIRQPIKQTIKQPIKQQQIEKNHLIGKWLPREKSSERDLFELLVKNLFPKIYERDKNRARKMYRKKLQKTLQQSKVKIPETKMSLKEDFSVEYLNTLPSYYRKNHTGLIKKGDHKGEKRYLERVHSENYNLHLLSKNKKINTQQGLMSVYKIMNEIINGINSDKDYYNKTYELMLEDIYNKTLEKLDRYETRNDFLVVLDGSGSMFQKQNNILPIIVGISLSIFCSKLNNEYKDIIIAFSDFPEVIQFTQNTWHDRIKYLYNEIHHSNKFGLSTNFDNLVDLVIDLFLKSNTNKFPSILLISDMQVNHCDYNYNNDTFIQRTLNKINNAYCKKKMNNDLIIDISKLFLLINVNSKYRNKPVTINDGGISMIGTTKQTVIEDFIVMNEFKNVYESMIHALDNYINYFHYNEGNQIKLIENFDNSIVKGGNDERFSGLYLLNLYLKKDNKACHIIKSIPQLGRFKDLHYFIKNGDDYVKEYALQYYLTLIKDYFM